MKVLENKNPKDNPIVLTCTHCQSILEVIKSDITYELGHHASTEFRVTCGACEHHFTVDALLLPIEWRRFIMNRDDPNGELD